MAASTSRAAGVNRCTGPTPGPAAGTRPRRGSGGGAAARAPPAAAAARPRGTTGCCAAGRRSWPRHGAHGIQLHRVRRSQSTKPWVQIHSRLRSPTTTLPMPSMPGRSRRARPEHGGLDREDRLRPSRCVATGVTAAPDGQRPPGQARQHQLAALAHGQAGDVAVVDLQHHRGSRPAARPRTAACRSPPARRSAGSGRRRRRRRRRAR
jgi:hypothetical protein